jgi:hypothetical protein
LLAAASAAQAADIIVSAQDGKFVRVDPFDAQVGKNSFA